MRSPDRGADTSVLLASDPDLRTVTGQFFSDGKQRRSSTTSYDTDVSRELWLASEALVGLGGHRVIDKSDPHSLVMARGSHDGC